MGFGGIKLLRRLRGKLRKKQQQHRERQVWEDKSFFFFFFFFFFFSLWDGRMGGLVAYGYGYLGISSHHTHTGGKIAWYRADLLNMAGFA